MHLSLRRAFLVVCICAATACSRTQALGLCQTPTDLGIAIPISANVTRWNLTRDFVVNLLKNAANVDGGSALRVGVVTYRGRATHNHFGFAQQSTLSEVTTSVGKLAHSAEPDDDKTIASAMETLLEDVFQYGNAVRQGPRVRRTALILVDETPDDIMEAKRQQQVLYNCGIRTIIFLNNRMTKFSVLETTFVQLADIYRPSDATGQVYALCQNQPTISPMIRSTVTDETSRNITLLNYDSNTQASWLLHAPDPNLVLTLSIKSFQTQQLVDIMHVYDGPDMTSQRIASFSGERVSLSLSSTSQYFYVRFASGAGTSPRHGFTIEYAARGRGESLSAVTTITDDWYTMLLQRECFVYLTSVVVACLFGVSCVLNIILLRRGCCRTEKRKTSTASKTSKRTAVEEVDKVDSEKVEMVTSKEQTDVDADDVDTPEDMYEDVSGACKLDEVEEEYDELAEPIVTRKAPNRSVKIPTALRLVNVYCNL